LLSITSDDVAPFRKSSIEAYNMFSQKLAGRDIDRRRCLYVDNSVRCYMNAKSAGFNVLLLIGSPNSRGYETCVPPEDVLLSMWQLPEFLDGHEKIMAYS